MSGFSRIDQFDLTRYGRQRGSIATISLISLCELIELTLLVMVITSSWLDYRKSNRSCSVFGFFQNLTTMRKVEIFLTYKRIKIKKTRCMALVCLCKAFWLTIKAFAKKAKRIFSATLSKFTFSTCFFLERFRCEPN